MDKLTLFTLNKASLGINHIKNYSNTQHINENKSNHLNLFNRN